MLSVDKKWYRVSLRFTGDHLPVGEIEKTLNLAPTYVGRKGDHIRGNPRFARHASNVWFWRYPSSFDVPFEDQIAGLMDILESRMAGLKEILSVPETIGELFLGFGSGNGQGGADFSPRLLKRIGESGLMLSLDLYPPSIDEEDDAPGDAA
jgi:hypothetical protein